MKYHTFSAMSTTILAGAEGEPGAVAEGFRKMETLIRRHEQQFTRFSQDSELSALNRSAGQWVNVSPEMFEVIRLARVYYLDTDGLFDPSVLPDLERAGYDRSIELVQAATPIVSSDRDQEALTARTQPLLIGGSISPAAPAARPSFATIELAEDRLAIRLPAGLRLDLGGIAKGWIADQAAHLLQRYVTACAVNAGGDQVTLGLPQGRDYWEVGLEDPFHPEQDLAILRVGPGAMATSSIIKRRWQQGREQRHHLIDPRSGEPAHSPWASVTVITQNATAAEVLAKTLIIAGTSGAEAIMARHTASAFIAVDLQGKLWGSGSSKEYLYEAY